MGDRRTRALAVVGFSLLVAGMGLASATTVVMQNGVNGYSGCKDKELRDKTVNFGVQDFAYDYNHLLVCEQPG